MKLTTILIFCLATLVVITNIYAQIPNTLSYQGLITDANGKPQPDGNYDLTFKLYDVSTGGSALWVETHTAVPVNGGLFSVILGEVASLTLDFNKQYYLGITIGAGTELVTRMPLTSSAYSLRAKVADSVVASTGVAYVALDDFYLTNTTSNQTVGSVNINAPADGYVIAMASGALRIDHVGAANGGESDVVTLNCSNNEHTAIYNTHGFSSVEVPPDIPTTGVSALEYPFTCQRLLGVNKGLNTIYLLVSQTSGNDPTHTLVRHALITVTYYPNNYTAPVNSQKKTIGE
jgi:hypothetical protein